MQPQRELKKIVEALSKEKGISKEIVVEALVEGIKTAALKKLGNKAKVDVRFDEETGEINVYHFKEVVDKVVDLANQISLEEAQKIDPSVKIGDMIGELVKIEDLGRIAAQVVKQVFSQKIRLAEKHQIYEEYKHKLGEIITGYVHKFNRGDVILNLGRAEALLPESEQIPGEKYHRGERVKALVIEVYRTKEPQIVVSRSHPAFVKKLFEKEVPEIQEGIIKIMAIAREPGSRTKIAVLSKDPNLDPVGACVGVRGSRISAVLQELKGEKIDVVQYDPDPAKFVYNALSPAECTKVIVDEATKTLEVIVPDDQLSLAIGRKGENVKLASKLVGWRIDILSETQYARRQEPEFAELLKVTGLSDEVAGRLYEVDIKSLKTLVETPLEKIAEITKLPLEEAQQILAKAKSYLEGKSS